MRTCARVTGSVHAMAVFAYLNRLPVAESPAPASDAASRFRARAEVTDVAEVPVLASDEGEVCTHCCGRRAVPDGMSTALVHCPRCTGRTGAKGGAA
jgi:hypothetical protein